MEVSQAVRAQPEEIKRFEPTAEMIEEVKAKLAAEGYTVKKTLGRGTFGVVFLAESEKHGEVAIKLGEKNGVPEKYIQRETAIQSFLHHKNVVRLHEVMEDSFSDGNGFICYIMELCDLDMDKYIHSKYIMKEDEIRYFFHGILCGLRALYDINCAHRDLKFENVMLKKDVGAPYGYVPKLADFGLTNQGDIFTSVVGTPMFVAPDVHNGYYDNKVDMWSLGVMLLYAVEGQAAAEELMKIVERGECPPEYTPSIFSKRRFSEQLFDLIRHLLVYYPEERYSIIDALCHPFFESIESRINMIFLGKQHEGLIVDNPVAVRATIPFSKVRGGTEANFTWGHAWNFALENNLFENTDTLSSSMSMLDLMDVSFYVRGTRQTQDDMVSILNTAEDLMVIVTCDDCPADPEQYDPTQASIIKSGIQSAVLPEIIPYTGSTIEEFQAYLDQAKRLYRGIDSFALFAFKLFASQLKNLYDINISACTILDESVAALVDVMGILNTTYVDIQSQAREKGIDLPAIGVPDATKYFKIEFEKKIAGFKPEEVKGVCGIPSMEVISDAHSNAMDCLYDNCGEYVPQMDELAKKIHDSFDRVISPFNASKDKFAQWEPFFYTMWNSAIEHFDLLKAVVACLPELVDFARFLSMHEDCLDVMLDQILDKASTLNGHICMHTITSSCTLMQIGEQ